MRLTAPSSGDMAHDINQVPEPIPDQGQGKEKGRKGVRVMGER